MYRILVQMNIPRSVYTGDESHTDIVVSEVELAISQTVKTKKDLTAEGKTFRQLAELQVDGLITQVEEQMRAQAADAKEVKATPLKKTKASAPKEKPKE